jgi:hypothetical protein
MLHVIPQSNTIGNYDARIQQQTVFLKSPIDPCHFCFQLSSGESDTNVQVQERVERSQTSSPFDRVTEMTGHVHADLYFVKNHI